MFFWNKIDDITTSFTPRSMQDLPMLLISPVSFFSIYFIFCLIIYIIKIDM